MKQLLLLAVFCLGGTISQAQILISDDSSGSTPESSAILEAKSDSNGMIIPRLTTLAIDSISNNHLAVAGMIVYDKDLKCYKGYEQGAWSILGSPCDSTTEIVEGSFAFTGFESENLNASATNNAADKISLVTFGTLSAGSVFYMTDSGFKADGTFRSSEGLIKWTVTSDIPARTEIVFESPQNVNNTFEWTVTEGVVERGTGDQSTGNGIAFTQKGDNLIVFTATDDTDPYGSVDTFITALKLENNWNANSTSTSTSAIPTGLVDGETAIAILATDNNMKIDCQYISSGMTEAQIRAVANDYTKWVAVTDIAETLPTACSY